MQFVIHGLTAMVASLGFLATVSISHSHGFVQTEETADPTIKLTSSEEDSALPSASDVIEKYVTAMGGYELLGSCQSAHFVFKGKSSNGSDLESFYYQARGQYFCQLTRGGLSVTRGVWSNGERNDQGLRVGLAWQSINDGPWTEKTGDELQEYLRRRSRVISSPYWKEDFDSIECVAKTEVRGISAWQLRFVDHDGKVIDRFFDTNTGYLLRRKTMESFDGNSHEVVRDYMDHEQKGDFVVATRQSISFKDTVEQWYVESFEYDGEVPEEVFDVPAAIQSRIDVVEEKRAAITEEARK